MRLQWGRYFPFGVSQHIYIMRLGLDLHTGLVLGWAGQGRVGDTWLRSPRTGQLITTVIHPELWPRYTAKLKKISGNQTLQECVVTYLHSYT